MKKEELKLQEDILNLKKGDYVTIDVHYVTSNYETCLVTKVTPNCIYLEDSINKNYKISKKKIKEVKDGYFQAKEINNIYYHTIKQIGGITEEQHEQNDFNMYTM